jgi:hypothetical protein
LEHPEESFGGSSSNMRIIPGTHQIHSQSFGLRARSTERLEFAEHRGHNHQRWQDLHSPSVGSGIEREIELVEHHSHLVDQGTGLETAD